MLIQNPIFIMSVGGTIAFLLYTKLYSYARDCFPVCWRRIVLMIATGLYLIPYPLFKYEFLKLLSKSGFAPLIERTNSVLINANRVILSDHDEKLIPLTVLLMYIVMGVSVVIAIGIVVYCSYHCINDILTIRRRDTPISDPRLQAQVRAVGIHRKIVFYVRDDYGPNDVHTPATIGFIRPIIVIPAEFLEKICSGEKKDLLRHELMHIKNNDFIWKIFAALAICVHWYNPYSYRLAHEIEIMCEIYADTMVTKDYANEEAHEYYNYIVDILELTMREQNTSMMLGFALIPKNADSKTVFERRIVEMDYRNQPKKKILAVVSAVAICLCAMPTAFAYSDPLAMDVDSVDSFVDSNMGDFTFEDDTPILTSQSSGLPYDSFFTDESGNVYDASSSKPEKGVCSHLYGNGTYSAHTPNGSGGCKVVEYYAQRCKLCGHIIVGEEKATHTYKVCPHDNP